MFKTSDKTDLIFKALFAAQKKIRPIKKGADNPYFKSKYADLNSILEEIIPHLDEGGVMMLQPVATDGTSNFVVTRFTHIESGQWVEASMKLELSKPTMQELGSAISYSRRYSPQSFLGLKAEDDDGNAASKTTAKGKTEAPKTPGSSFRPSKPAATNGAAPPAVKDDADWMKT